MSADGEVTSAVLDAGADLEAALARWADGFAAAAGVGPLRPPPTAWCSWYHYFERVTQDDIEENLRAIDDLGLDIDVVQIDDGYQAEIGDWLLLSDRFAVAGGHRRPHPRGRPPRRHLGGAVPGGRAVGARPGAPRLAGRGRRARAPGGPTSSLARPRRHAPGGRGLPARGLRHLPGPGHRLLQDRFHLCRGDGGTAGPSRRLRRRGLPARAARDPRGDRAGRLPARVRRADPAQRRAGRRHAGRSGHRATTSSRWTATSRSPPSGPRRRTAGGGRGSTAGSGSTTPTAWSPDRTWSGARSGRPSSRQYSGLRASSDRLRGLDEWGLETTRRLLRRGLTTPFVP